MVAALVLAACCSPATVLAAPRTPDARQRSVLSVASVSPWVASDGEFQVRFDPTTSLPAEAQLTITIHEPVDADEGELADELGEIIRGGEPGRVLQTPLTVPFAQLGDPTSGPVLTIPVRSTRGTSDRVLLPNPGPHPVELVVTAPDGPELWSRTVFLNRLPEADDEAPAPPAPVDVALVLPVDAATSTGREGFGVEDRTRLGSIASLLSAVPDAPLVLAARPDTLDRLATSAEPWASDLLDVLSDPRPQRVIAQLPYVEVDSGGLVASGARGELERQLVVGAATVAERLGRSPVPGAWVGDSSLTPEVLPVLRDAGVGRLLLPLDDLDLPDEVDDDLPVRRPVPIRGGEGMTVTAFDPLASERLVDAATDPAVRAHEALSIVLASWFERGEGDDPLATALLLTPGTDPEVLASLGAALTSGGPLLAGGDVSSAGSTGADVQGPIADLVPRTPPDLRSTVAATTTTRGRLEAYRSMTGTADPDADLWDQFTDRTLARTLDPGDRAQLHAAVRGGVAAKVALIEPPRARRVVLTSDDTVIPLRFRNDLPFEVRLVLRARSPRLAIDRPTREILLAPGENVVDLPVKVRAPGESLLRIELQSPDEGISIPGPAVPVRSTAISGVGAALSIVSILFLCVWWFRTMRRRRREHARDGGNHPSSDPDLVGSTDGG